MEKPIIWKCHKHLWFVILFSFLLFFVLLGFDYSSLIGGKNGVTFLVNNYANTINTPRSNLVNSTSKSNKNISPLITTDNPSSEVTRNFTEAVDQVNNVTVHKKKPVFVPASAKKENRTKAVAKQPSEEKKVKKKSDLDSCLGRYIYVHDLPSQFNDDVLKNCSLLVKWFSMCPFVINSGLGPQIENPEEVLLNNSWFSTNQFLLEVIFLDRMKQYKCLTNDSSLASAIYVPFYAGLDIGRYLWDYNTSVRDSSGFGLVKWLAQKPEWKRMWGRDHFFVSGRIAWDFRRQTDDDKDWGSKLMSLPESMNMTMLSIESTSWSNEFAIPYPTYFHPSSDGEVFQWQSRMRSQKRSYLFAFAGAPRPTRKDSIRNEIINQCLASNRTCKWLDCNSGENKCDNPVEVIKVFQNSVFCLQPPGDSYTRRSTFDSILAGCIPVFFHPGSAYAQYLWHLPKNYTRYSIFIPMTDVKEGKVSINQRLLRVSKDEVLAMREEVIRLIPKVIYANPSSKLETIEDAFDIAVKEVVDRVEHVRREIEEGKDPSIGFAQENSWKLKLSGTGREHEWVHFF